MFAKLIISALRDPVVIFATAATVVAVSFAFDRWQTPTVAGVAMFSALFAVVLSGRK